ncbi:hypothetical protein GCM10009069_09870 [Algimonas arctica]|uniref:Uncharacterized protein n=1 Tax=Algimonas arctica TaxID=1479486 RepID=A0A8J3G1U4_9PROT|nr:hypothetical protein [Algimonas arctica]GHA88860.1 hypothetical protein GCM10009069_09870 [Algimonas arctica]
MSKTPDTKISPLSTGIKKAVTLVVSLVAFLGAVTSLLLNGSRLTSQGDEVEGTVQMIVSLAEQQPDVGEDWDVFDQYQVDYELETSGTEYLISYTTDYFDLEPKRVGILSEGPYFNLPKVGLDIKLVNNSDEAIFVTEASIDVQTSTPDNRPLMAFTHHEGVVGEIEFTNDGWGEPTSLVMTAAIEGPASQNPQVLPSSKLDSSSLLGARYMFDMSPLLEPYGISGADIRAADALTDGDDFEAESAAWAKVHIPCMRALATPDILSNAYAILYGEEPRSGNISLTEEDLTKMPYGCGVMVNGNLLVTWQEGADSKTQTINFRTFVSISPPEGLGSTGFEPTGSYDVAFKPSGTTYTLTVPLSQPIRPKDFDRFSIWLGAPRSSTHVFKVRLKYNEDQELPSNSMNFQYLRPRGNASRSNLARTSPTP